MELLEKRSLLYGYTKYGYQMPDRDLYMIPVTEENSFKAMVKFLEDLDETLSLKEDYEVSDGEIWEKHIKEFDRLFNRYKYPNDSEVIVYVMKGQYDNY